MELEHQHDWRLPDTDSEPNGFGFADADYPNSNTDSHTGYPNTDTNSHASHTNTDPNGHGIPDTYTGDTNPNSDPNGNANTRPDLHGDVRQPGANHDCGHAAGDALPE
jgi:hypothetical protein